MKFDCVQDVLLKKGLDLEDKNLFVSPEYQTLKEEYVFYSGRGRVTLDYLVEKVLLSQKQINEMKQGYFDINVKKKDQIPKMTATTLYNEIYREKVAGKSTKEIDNMDIENIRQKIEGLKSGLKVKLKKEFNFNFDKFKGQKYSKFKLVKLLYKMHEKESKLYDILGNPCLEGVDNGILNYDSIYGKIIAELKNEVMKEVDIEFVKRVKESTLSICIEWENILKEVSVKLLLLDKAVLTSELERINNVLKSIVDRLPDVKTLDTAYENSVFETFYLKLIQYECVGRQHDLKKINSYEGATEEVAERYKGKYYQTLAEPVIIDEIEAFIDENIDRVTEFVYMADDVKEVDENFIRKDKSKELLKNFLKVWCRNTVNKNVEEVSLLIVISAIQEIIITNKKKEEHVLKYFGYKRAHPTLISKLKKGLEAREAYQILWVRKVKQRIYANLGLNEQGVLLTSIERSVDTITTRIMQYSNMLDMLKVNEYFIRMLKRSIINNSDIEANINDMCKKIYDKRGYCLRIDHGNVFNYFKETKTIDICSQVDQTILDKINELEKNRYYRPDMYEIQKGYRIDLKLSDMNGENQRDFLLKYHINIDRKIVCLENFWEIKSDEYVYDMAKLGLNKFFKA